MDDKKITQKAVILEPTIDNSAAKRAIAETLEPKIIDALHELWALAGKINDGKTHFLNAMFLFMDAKDQLVSAVKAAMKGDDDTLSRQMMSPETIKALDTYYKLTQ